MFHQFHQQQNHRLLLVEFFSIAILQTIKGSQKTYPGFSISKLAIDRYIPLNDISMVI